MVCRVLLARWAASERKRGESRGPGEMRSESGESRGPGEMRSESGESRWPGEMRSESFFTMERTAMFRHLVVKSNEINSMIEP